MIVRFDGQDVRSSTDLPRIVAATPVGKEVAVVVMRSGKEENLKVTLGRLEDGERQAALGAGSAPGGAVKPPASAVQKALGMEFSGMSAALRKQYNIKDSVNGVVVTKIDPSSPAAEKRVQAGDVIVEINQQAVKDPERHRLAHGGSQEAGPQVGAVPCRQRAGRSALRGAAGRSRVAGARASPCYPAPNHEGGQAAFRRPGPFSFLVRASPSVGMVRDSLQSSTTPSPPCIALRIEQRGEIAEVDARVGGGRDGRLGVEGDAEARFAEHGEIVRAVADRHRLVRARGRWLRAIR